MPRRRVFLLSPAGVGGKRADLIFNDRAQFELAMRIRRPQGAPLGEVFSFLSGLYFRGKLAYATHFARPPQQVPRALVITAGRGLLDANHSVTLDDLRNWAEVNVDVTEPRYVEPLVRDAARLATSLGRGGEVILLGSIATPKYCQPLGAVLGRQLRFPAEFSGRGDMSRGGLMLRCVDEGRELEYVSLEDGLRRGRRPERLPPRVRS